MAKLNGDERGIPNLIGEQFRYTHSEERQIYVDLTYSLRITLFIILFNVMNLLCFTVVAHYLYAFA
jgi:hypothetical protein